MKKRYFLFGCVLLMACGTTTPPSPPAPPVFTGTVTGVTIDTRVFNVRENGSSVLLGIVSGTGDFNQALNWKIESGGVGKLSSTTGNNVLYTAPSSTFGQVVRITASSVQDPTQKKTIYLGVHPSKQSIAAGGSHSLALKPDGTILAWGSDSFGQIGEGSTFGNSTDNRPTPVGISSANASGIVAVAAGENHSLALKPNGTILAWGSDSNGQLGNDLGFGQASDNKSLPVAVDPQNINSAVAIAAGDQHSLALLPDGRVRAWGNNSSGQLGNGTRNNGAPLPVSVLNASGIVAIAAGRSHSLALKSDGTILAWGFDFFGSLGNGGVGDQSTPVQVWDATDIVAIAAGGYNSLALKSDGTMLNWGLLNGTGAATAASVPKAVPNATGITAISASGLHFLALKSDGTMLAWGDDQFGQMGDDTTNNPNYSETPIPVSSATGIVAIAAGGTHSLALKSDGTMLSWGEDKFGQLGNNASYGAIADNKPTAVSVLLGTFTIRVP